MEQQEKYLCNPSSHYGKCKKIHSRSMRHNILIHENNNAPILAISNSSHNVIAVRSVLVILCLALKPLRINCESSPIRSCEERMGAQSDSEVAP